MTMTSFSQLKTLFSVCALMLASLATGVASAETSRHARLQAWDANKASAVQMNPGLGVRAGQAPIEQALLTLVPPPYQIQLAQSIDRSTVLQWAENPDWYVGLRLALAQHGLLVQPDWNKNTVLIRKPFIEESHSGSQKQRSIAVADNRISVDLPIASSVAPTSHDVNQVEEPHSSKGKSSFSVAQSWFVKIEDVTLENTFKRWAEQANYQLLWDTDREILIPAKDEFFGTFEEALSRVLQSPAIRNSEHPIEAVIYANQPPLVRITRMGEQ